MEKDRRKNEENITSKCKTEFEDTLISADFLGNKALSVKNPKDMIPLQYYVCLFKQ